MLHLLTNSGQRRLLALFMSLMLLTVITASAVSESVTRRVLATQIEEKIALIGYLSESGLLVESEQMNHITLSGLLDGRYDNTLLASGQSWLAAYGFAEPDTWTFYAAYGTLKQRTLLSVFLPAACVLLLLAFFCRQILSGLYRQIRRIADVSHLAAAGSDSMLLTDVSIRDEGDLAVLWHATVHLIERVSAQLQSLKKDKRRLQDFLSDISHQIKTPLASLQLYLDLMQDTAMTQDKRASFIEQGLAQVRRIDWLVQGLLKMARLDAGSVEMKLIPADLSTTVQQAVAPFSEIIRQRHLSVRNLVEQGTIWPHDPEWLSEAISNLIKNALEQVPERGEISISSVQTPLSLQLQISDSGPGIPSQEISRIFERFYRHDTAIRPDSVGIGLSLARAIVEQNGGDLTASSPPGSGAVFTISFLKNP